MADRIDYSSQPQPAGLGGPDTAGVHIENEDGETLDGAVVAGEYVYDGNTPVTVPVDGGPPDSLTLPVVHLGRDLGEFTVTSEDFDTTGTLPTATINSPIDGFPSPNSINDIQAVWMSENDLRLIWWQSLPDEYTVRAVSARTDIDWERVFREINNPGSSEWNWRRIGSRGDSDLYSVWAEPVTPDTQNNTDIVSRTAEYNPGTSAGKSAQLDPSPGIHGSESLNAVAVYSENERLGPVSTSYIDTNAHTADANSIELIMGPKWPEEGQRVAIQARAGDGGLTNVTWSGTAGVVFVEKGDTGCIVEAADGESVIAEQGSVSQSIILKSQASITLNDPPDGTPPAPQDITTEPHANDAARISWEKTPSAAQSVRISDGNRVWETRRQSVVIRKLPPETQGLDFSYVDNKGQESNTTSVPVSPGQPAARPAVYQTSAIPELHVKPGETNTLDLTTYLDPPASGDWTDLKAREHHFRTTGPFQNSEYTVSMPDNQTLDVALAAGVDTDDDRRDLIVLEYIDTSDAGSRPMFISVPVISDTDTKTGGAYSIGAVSHKLVAERQVDAERLAGESPSEYKSSRLWEPALSSFGRGLLNDVSDDGTYQIPDGGREDFVLTSVIGDKGLSLLTLPVHEGAGMGSVQFPPEPISQIENVETWSSYSASRLEPGKPQTWRRALTGGSNLYDLFLLEPPKPITYRPPIYFQGSWLNRSEYPDDAAISYTDGLVRYRSGLSTDSTTPTQPTIEKLQVVPVPNGLDVKWQARVFGEDVTGALTVDVIDDDGNISPAEGDGTLQLRGLKPSEQYDIEIAGATRTASPLHQKPSMNIIAWTDSDLTYTYRYENSGGGFDKFTDTFGNTYDLSSTDFPIEVSGRSDAVREHVVQFQWTGAGAEVKPVRIPVNWQLPPSGTEIKTTGKVAQRIPAAGVVQPKFFRVEYRGEATYNLPRRIYKQGDWRIEPVGYLPLGMNGALEEYVRTWFVRPSGEDLGNEASIDVQRAELGARVAVQAVEEQTPVVVGARVVPVSNAT